MKIETKHGCRRVIKKASASAAIAVGCVLWAAAPASAEPNPVIEEPNPFGGFSCNCGELAPEGPAVHEDLLRGMRNGLA
ncbi:hypothetical protein MB901379_04216 [Mycobacterium basiliense]|uniref:Secreted protein n=1 Tax=Mycobacterium basiliense TaxID=2094119 RepID=A0A3S4DW51_9MYCO|nr:hypothetical protein [Mycobacterium basiliense]VDM90614.1 hypothetical protein MB901379_04216 [Mycobacterium basiliense]